MCSVLGQIAKYELTRIWRLIVNVLIARRDLRMNTVLIDAAKVEQHGRLERSRDNETRCKIGARWLRDIDKIRYFDRARDRQWNLRRYRFPFRSTKRGVWLFDAGFAVGDAILIATWSWPKYPPRPPG